MATAPDRWRAEQLAAETAERQHRIWLRKRGFSPEDLTIREPSSGENALHHAMREGLEELAEYIHKKDETLIKVQNTYGSTPLRLACINQHDSMARWAIDLGAVVTDDKREHPKWCKCEVRKKKKRRKKKAVGGPDADTPS